MTGKRFLLIGCGKQARAIAYYLAKRAGAARITMLDMDPLGAMRLADWLSGHGVARSVLDPVMTSFDALGPAEESAARMRGYDVVVNAAGNAMNVLLSTAAIMARVRYCDIGHDDAVIEKQYALSEAAAKAGVILMPGCGIAPGGSQVAVRRMIDLYEERHGETPECVQIRCGGIPLAPAALPLRHATGFALSGLVTECKLPSKVLRQGREVEEPSLEGIEVVGGFPLPHFGTLHATATGGNLGTLTRTYADRISDMDYKTLRWPGHWEFIQMLDRHRLLDEVPLPDGRTARAATVEYLRKLIPDVSEEYPDALVLRITAARRLGRPDRSVRFDLVDKYDTATGLTAMERTTGFSAGIVAEMLANYVGRLRGTLTQEGGIPADAFLKAWEAAGIRYSITHTP